MSFNDQYLCIGCKVDQKTAANLNKHLFECNDHKNFMKTYIPPKCITCSFCSLIFINKDYLLTHTCKKN